MSRARKEAAPTPQAGVRANHCPRDGVLYKLTKGFTAYACLCAYHMRSAVTLGFQVEEVSPIEAACMQQKLRGQCERRASTRHAGDQQGELL